MTRATLRHKLRRITVWLTAVIAVALIAQLAANGLVPELLAGQDKIGKAIYELLKDMAVVIVTIAAAYLAGIFQRRSKFIESLEEEWRGIVRTKSRLFTYCELPSPTYEDYVRAFCSISEAIDSMRIVYRNVGETDDKIGLYPYVPLHDMRRAFQTLDPSRGVVVDEVQRKLVRDAILQCFYAMRETFLEELDLEEPISPQVVAASVRAKQSGATKRAQRLHDAERAAQAALPRPRPDVDALLKQALERERERERLAAAAVRGPKEKAEKE